MGPLAALAAIAVSLPVAHAKGSSGAVLRLDPVEGGKPKYLAGLLAEWSSLDLKVAGMPVVQAEGDLTGCSRQPRCLGCALLVWQGNCTFAAKARFAQNAGAALLIVVSNKEGPPPGMAAVDPPRRRFQVFPPQPLSIPAVMVSKNAGRQVFLSLSSGEEFEASCEKYDSKYGDVASEIFVGVLAVSLVMLGAWHSVEDLRRPESKEKFNEEVLAVEESSGLQFVMFGSLMLTVLFFFMKYLIYILLFLFATGAVSTTAMLLEPVIAAWRPSLRATRACKVPKWLTNVLGVAEEHSWSDAIAELIGGVLAVSFLIYRNNASYGWLLQDTIAIMLLLTIQRTLRLPNLKVGTLLLVCTFFFDIFWVFLSPLIFKKSVMIEVATGGGTGQSVPMVLKIPAMTGALPGQFKILGLGDIAIPGLLISLLLRHDLASKVPCGKGYFTAGVVGYALGLVATFVSLYLMQHGQPALLFLVPGTLVPTFAIAARKGEFQQLWSADYGPEQPPEGYAKLEDNDTSSKEA